MLSVSVVLSVSVEGATECRMHVNDVFCAVSLSGTMWSAMYHSKKTHPTAASPRPA